MGQYTLLIDAYQRDQRNIIILARIPRLSKVTFLRHSGKSSRTTIFGTHAAYLPTQHNAHHHMAFGMAVGTETAAAAIY